jgi:putative Mg2+ transporter-C (MgtC) family protein
MLALISTVLTLLVLILFHIFEDYLDKVHHEKLLRVVFSSSNYNDLLVLEEIIHKHQLKLQRRLVDKKDGCLQAAIFVTGHKKNIARLDEKLLNMPEIKSF